MPHPWRILRSSALPISLGLSTDTIVQLFRPCGSGLLVQTLAPILQDNSAGNIGIRLYAIDPTKRSSCGN
jgi:hypothetical protein